jgi:acyl transferase domain-containing protein
MAPLLGRPLSDYVFADAASSDAMARAEESLRQTAITQPAVLTVDVALTRLLAEYGIEPDMVMGHSLGEYAALVAAGSLPFRQALEAVSARGKEMHRVSVADNGRMAAVFAPLGEVERVLATVGGYVVVANVNSYGQAVIGGATDAVEAAVAAFHREGMHVRALPVSHAFHTRIVAPASEPLRRVLAELDLRPPRVPVVANVHGDFYPMGDGAVPEMIDLLARQIASPVQFVRGLETLYGAGVRVLIGSVRRRRFTGLRKTSSGRRRMRWRCSRITRRWATRRRSTTDCAACGPPARGWPARCQPIPRESRSPRSTRCQPIPRISRVPRARPTPSLASSSPGSSNKASRSTVGAAPRPRRPPVSYRW